MTYNSFRTKITPLYKKLNLLKLDDIYRLKLGKIMHKFHSGNLPDNFNHLFTPVNQVHFMQRAVQLGVHIFGKWPTPNTEKGL